MNKNIQELIKLSTENPNLRIITMVDNEVFFTDEYKYCMGEIISIEKDIIYQPDEIVYIGEQDIYDQIHEDLQNDDSISDEIVEDDDERMEKLVDDEFKKLKDSGKIEEVIIIYIGV